MKPIQYSAHIVTIEGDRALVQADYENPEYMGEEMRWFREWVPAEDFKAGEEGILNEKANLLNVTSRPIYYFTRP